MPAIKSFPFRAQQEQRSHWLKGRSRDQVMLRLVAQLADLKIGSVEGLEWLAESAREAFDAGAAALLLLQEGKGELVLKKSEEVQPDWRYELDLDWESGLIEGCLREKFPLQFGPDSVEVKIESVERLFGLNIQSMICMPLVLNDLVLGAIAVINRPHRSFARKDQALLAQLGEVITHKIYEARLIQQLKVTNAELEASHWQLLRSRNTLRALFDSIPTSIYIIDQKYRLAAINMHRARRANNAPNLLVGRLCYEALYGRSDVCRDCQVVETLLAGQNTSRNKRHWELEDEPQEWEISTYPIYDNSNQVIQAILHEQDVTEKRRLEATLAQSEKLAAVGQLAAGLAHEINNPLTAIIANAQLLQRELAPGDDKQELVDLINRAGARASQVVHNLLDLARKEQYNFALTDLNETINRSVKLLQHEILARSIDLTWEPAENLPPIMASQDHLQGVWINLLSNALDAMEGDDHELHISTRQQGNEIRVLIADNGSGIPPDKLTRIFEPFYTTKAPGRGTGLGLSVCYRIIKQHGGQILVDSKPGAGSQFSVILPIS